MPWYEFNQVQTHFQRSSEIKAVLVMDAPFAELLKVFLYLNECLAPNSLLVLAPLKSKNIQDLHRMILSHYAWIELDYLAQTVILCRVAAA
jgi:hypothetical protein